MANWERHQLTVLMVAEKPSIATTLAEVLSGNSRVLKRKGKSPSSPVHEFGAEFQGRAAHFKITSTVGHMYSLDFHPNFNDQQKVDPVELFDAPTIHLEDERPRMTEHLRNEAADADILVLWLDCDREGENICFEVSTAPGRTA